MKKAIIVTGALVAVLGLTAVAVCRWADELGRFSAEATSSALPLAPPSAGEGHAAPVSHEGYIYGRVSTVDGATYEGRMRWGGDEEAFWSDYFNGFKDVNPWREHIPPERLKERRPIRIFGFAIASRVREVDLGRPFMARMGDIARIEARGGDVRVTLKSGTTFDLDRFAASDFDDGVRVWDGRRGVVDLDSLRIREIEFLPTPSLEAVPYRLHGTVRTREGDFTGFLQWNREKCVGSDTLLGHTADDRLELRFDTIASIARHESDGSRVTLLDGREIVLSGRRNRRGLYVDDRRYGRVLVSWDAFERVDFSPSGSGPAYGDYRPGRPLTGSVTTHAGERLTGRLVYDLDESDTTETLDAPLGGVDYTIPFGRIASILPENGAGYAGVTFHDGEELQLEHSGDLGERNAGLLVFVEGRGRPEYVAWTDVERIDLDPPPDGH